MHCKKRRLIKPTQYYATVPIIILEVFKRELVMKKLMKGEKK